jgi:hypothetical protein
MNNADKEYKEIRRIKCAENTPFAYECILLCDGKYHSWKDLTTNGLWYYHQTEPYCNCNKKNL